MDENRKKALAQALGQIEKQFGKGSVMRMGDAQAARDIDAVSTGSIGLDVALGIGGLPKGRVVEIYGPESSGKTTLARLVARASEMRFVPFSAVLSGVKEVRAAVARACHESEPTCATTVACPSRSRRMPSTRRSCATNASPSRLSTSPTRQWVWGISA